MSALRAEGGAVMDANRLGGLGAGLAMVADQPIRLVSHRTTLYGQPVRTVHLVPVDERHPAGAVGALCGALLSADEIETDLVDQGVPCTPCVMNQVRISTPLPDSSGDCADYTDSPVSVATSYQSWGWPVTQHRDQLRLNLNRDASAIAIPIPLSAAVIQILTARHCAPAVLANPSASDHHVVLVGEGFGAALPWPAGVHQVAGAVSLPPSATARGPITWVQPPGKDSLRLSREIDVFGALRTVLS
ncbi:MAG: hypothetical protein ACRDSH_06610 [Pseudonocardiaceae bacterium]